MLVVGLDGDPTRLPVDGVATSPVVEPLDMRIVDALTERPLTRTSLRERLGVRNETADGAVGTAYYGEAPVFRA